MTVTTVRQSDTVGKNIKSDRTYKWFNRFLGVFGDPCFDHDFVSGARRQGFDTRVVYSSIGHRYEVRPCNLLVPL